MHVKVTKGRASLSHLPSLVPFNPNIVLPTHGSWQPLWKAYY